MFISSLQKSSLQLLPGQAALQPCDLTLPTAGAHRQTKTLTLGAITEAAAKAGFKRLTEHWGDYTNAGSSSNGDTKKATSTGNSYTVHENERDSDGNTRSKVY